MHDYICSEYGIQWSHDTDLTPTFIRHIRSPEHALLRRFDERCQGEVMM
ncbi:hypothetical protein Pla52o_53920 [Novipirellula galeiformis]|uniref:Uncharacterized protein n=1 Tax=Novipirellula galeiformis TaxID=2528004 RepID=A0A5C6BZT7_9BACT|nr:hypothetical protein Pla52o_53920 [Novipirellula galeiformis]